MGPHLDPALGMQGAQRLADRDVAHTELAREGVGVEMAAGLEGAQQDRLGEDVAYPVGGRAIGARALEWYQRRQRLDIGR